MAEREESIFSDEDGADDAADAEAAFASFLARTHSGEAVDFPAFCAERPSIAESLVVLHNAWQGVPELSQRTEPEVSAQVQPPETIGEFLSARAGRGSVSLDPDAPADDKGSGIRDRLQQLDSRSGRYTLREEVARGGMGVILKIWDKDLRRTLAMKASFHNFGNLVDGEIPEVAQDSVARFMDEAQITAQLDHPGIVPVHELGVDKDGRLYFTMRLVKGHTLDEIFKLARKEQDGWTQARAVSIMVQVCDAMTYAHAKGVIHRDLKPANIMVGDFGEVYVMDWGLAKVLGRHDPHQRAWVEATSVMRSQIHTDRGEDVASVAESPLMTMEGTIVGTPTYMPPEQAEGRIDALDPRSDVYSVGALLYTLLAGRMPYVDPKETNISAGQVLLALIAGPPLPVTEIDSSVPPELVAICEKAMQRNPEDRYQRMKGMSEDLRAYIENRVVQAYASGPVAEFRKWVTRNKAVAASVALLILVTIGGSVWIALQQHRNVVEVSLAAAETRKEKQRAEKNEIKALAAAEDARTQMSIAARQSYLASLAAASASLRMTETAEAKQLLQSCPESARGWEWRHLWYATDTSLRKLGGKLGRVLAVRFTPDGKRVIAATENQSIRVWDLESGESFPLPAVPSDVTALDLSPDGGRIAAASKVDGVRIWDAGSTTLESMLRHKSEVVGVCFLDEEGTRIVTGDEEGVYIWDVAAQAKLLTIPVEEVVAVIASSNGKLIITVDEMELRMFDAETGEEKHEALELEDGGSCLAVYGNLVAVGSRDKTVRIVSMETGKIQATLSGPTDFVTAVHFSSDGTRLAASSFDRTVRVWDVQSSAQLDVLLGHESHVRSLHCTGSRLVSGADDGTVRFWSPASGGHIATLPGDEDSFSDVAFDPQGKFVAATGAVDGELRVWNSATGDETLLVPASGAALTCVAYSADGKFILAGSASENAVRVHNALDGSVVQLLEGHDVRITSIAVRGDGMIATGSNDDSVRVWTLDGADPIVFGGHKAHVQAVAFGQGDLLASADDSGVVLIRKVSSTDKPMELKGHTDAVYALAFSPDGKVLASAGADRVVRLWNAATGELLFEMTGHSDRVLSLAFHPTESRLASAGRDKTVRIWNTQTAQPLLRLLAHDSWVTGVVFSADGSTLATSSQDQTVRLWRTGPALTASK